MKLFRNILILCICILAVGCGRFSNPFRDDKVLARVGDVSLYLTEVETIFTPELTPEDSIQLLESYVDMWVKKQLKIQEAERMFKSNAADIERMVEDYRNSLLTYKLDQYYVDNNADTVFTDKQIADYFGEHKSDFVLDRAIVKGIVAKIPDNYRQMAQLKELMRSSDPAKHKDFVDICTKNNFELKEYSTWIDFSEFTLPLPVQKEGEGVTFSKRDVQEINDGGLKYLVLITEGRGIGDQAPFEIERIQDMIRRVMYNQRKQEVIRTYEDSLYLHAKEGKKIIVNVN